MHRTSVSTRIAALVLVATVGLTAAACGGSDESSSSSTTTTAAAESTTSTTASSGSSTGEVDCASVQTALDTVAQLSEKATSEGAAFNAQQFAADLPELRTQTGVLEEQATLAGAPAEAVQLYTAGNNTLIDLLEQFAQNENSQEFESGLQSYQTPEYTAASDQISEALRAQCPTLTDPLSN
jgi:hypothetical protein